MASFRLIPLLSLLTLLLVTSSVFGQASDSSTENQKPNTASERPAATNSSGLDPRITTTRLSIRDRLRARANAQKALPKVNQALVDDVKKQWDSLVFPRELPAFEKQMAALIRVYQTEDEEAWKSLTDKTGNKAREFEAEHAAFAGGPMHFISGIDGFETNAAVQIRCFFPVDKDGKRVGTKLHFIVTGTPALNGDNVLAIHNSGTGDLPTDDDVKGAMAYLAKKYSLPPAKKTSKGESDSETGSTPAGGQRNSRTPNGKSTQAPAKSSNTDGARSLPKVNQTVLKNLKRNWDEMEYSDGQKRTLETALKPILDALQRKDYETCVEIMGPKFKEMDFGSLHNALYGKNNRYLYGEDGWKVAESQSTIAYTYMPVDSENPNRSTGALGYFVTHPIAISTKNPIGLIVSVTSPAFSQGEIATVILDIKEVFTVKKESVKQ